MIIFGFPLSNQPNQMGRVDDIWLLNKDPKSLKPVVVPRGTTPNSMKPKDMI